MDGGLDGGLLVEDEATRSLEELELLQQQLREELDQTLNLATTLKNLLKQVKADVQLARAHRAAKAASPEDIAQGMFDFRFGRDTKSHPLDGECMILRACCTARVRVSIWVVRDEAGVLRDFVGKGYMEDLESFHVDTSRVFTRHGVLASFADAQTFRERVESERCREALLAWLSCHGPEVFDAFHGPDVGAHPCIYTQCGDVELTVFVRA